MQLSLIDENDDLRPAISSGQAMFKFRLDLDKVIKDKALLDFPAQKSERLQTPLPWTQSVVKAARPERKPGGLEYGVPRI